MKTMNTDIRPRKFQGLLEIMKALVIMVYYLSSTKNFGLLSEFYKKFWHLCESLINFSCCFRIRILSISQRQAVITLIDKRDKDRSYLNNWINSTPYGIHSHESGYVEGKYVDETNGMLHDWVMQGEASHQPKQVIDLPGCEAWL